MQQARAEQSRNLMGVGVAIIICASIGAWFYFESGKGSEEAARQCAINNSVGMWGEVLGVDPQDESSAYSSDDCEEYEDSPRQAGAFVAFGVVATLGLGMVVAGGAPRRFTATYPASTSTTPSAGTKVCPFCAETILVAAIKCKHCRADI